MDDNKDKLEFFSNIRDKLLLILCGIISLATVIPAFLNSTSQIFGWEHISVGYYVFVAFYFILPYVFYLLYCSIHDDVGYLGLLPQPALDFLDERKGLKTAVELLLPLVALLYLVAPGIVFDLGMSIIFCASGLVCFILFLVAYYKSEALRKEFLIVGTIIILLFSLFFSNLIHRECKNGGRIFSYTAGKQDTAFMTYEAREALKSNFTDLLDSVKNVAGHYRAQAAVYYPASVNARIKYTPCKGCCLDELAAPVFYVDASKFLTKDSIIRHASTIRANALAVFSHENSILANKDTSRFSDIYTIDRYCVLLSDYAQQIKKAKLLDTAGKWAALLKVLQYKSLAWFFFLILLGLCMWLKMQVRLQRITNKKSSQVPLLKDDISQVQSLIFLLFVLIIPWFRTIDTKDVELDKPFLNLTLSGLANGNYSSGTDVIITDARSGKLDSLLIIKKDTGKSVYHDSLLDTINKHVKESQKLIKDQAKRTIGNARDRNVFDDKNPLN